MAILKFLAIIVVYGTFQTFFIIFAIFISSANCLKHRPPHTVAWKSIIRCSSTTFSAQLTAWSRRVISKQIACWDSSFGYPKTLRVFEPQLLRVNWLKLFSNEIAAAPISSFFEWWNFPAVFLKLEHSYFGQYIWYRQWWRHTQWSNSLYRLYAIQIFTMPAAIDHFVSLRII
jgi:hypothetical protein